MRWINDGPPRSYPKAKEPPKAKPQPVAKPQPAPEGAIDRVKRFKAKAKAPQAERAKAAATVSEVERTLMAEVERIVWAKAERIRRTEAEAVEFERGLEEALAQALAPPAKGSSSPAAKVDAEPVASSPTVELSPVARKMQERYQNRRPSLSVRAMASELGCSMSPVEKALQELKWTKPRKSRRDA
jgi:hypothetical protein